MNKISRAEARAQGLTRYYTGKPCKHGHLSERRTGNANCVECGREADAKRRETEEWKRYHRERSSIHYEANKDLYEERRKTYRAENKEHVRASGRAYNRKYHELHREERLRKNKAWRDANPGITQSYKAKRRARKLRASPSWADTAAIRAIYKEASLNPDIHVDHIVALKGVDSVTGEHIVCGLHVENNLQLLSAEENLRKANIFDRSAYEKEWGDG